MTILLSDLEFYAYHGVPDAEQEVGHRYRVSARLELSSCGAEISDDISETLNYAEAASVVQQVGTSEQFRTLERLATAMGQTLLAVFPVLDSVEIKAEKIAPPMPFVLTSVGVVTNILRS